MYGSALVYSMFDLFACICVFLYLSVSVSMCLASLWMCMDPAPRAERRGRRKRKGRPGAKEACGAVEVVAGGGWVGLKEEEGNAMFGSKA